MENLEKLKDVWKNQGESSIKFSKTDIYDMVHKKSTSIVKWILIISILEFVLPNIAYFFTGFSSTEEVYNSLGIANTMHVFLGVHLVVILAFIYIFYKNYKNISAESNVKTLLHNILNTRKTVKYYIYYNLIGGAISSIYILYLSFNSEEFLSKLSGDVSMVVVWGIALFILAIALLLFWFFYRIIYGILLKKLNTNYEELLNND